MRRYYPIDALASYITNRRLCVWRHIRPSEFHAMSFFLPYNGAFFAFGRHTCWWYAMSRRLGRHARFCCSKLSRWRILRDELHIVREMTLLISFQDFHNPCKRQIMGLRYSQEHLDTLLFFHYMQERRSNLAKITLYMTTSANILRPH